MAIVSRHPCMPVPSRFTRFTDFPEDVIGNIASRLSLVDFFCFLHACSKAMRGKFDFRIFQGEPYFLRETFGEIDKCWFYSTFMRKWQHLEMPVQTHPPRWKPISASGGLVLFSGVGFAREDSLLFMRRWWPVIVINPITRQMRRLSLGLEFPPEVNKHTWRSRCYWDVQMAIKVNMTSATYKVVVLWKNSYMVQIFDSRLNRWATVSVPRELRAYSNSSNDIVLCRSSFRTDGHQATMFDLENCMLVDYGSTETRTGVIRAGIYLPEHIVTGFPSIGRSCLYAVDYSEEDPITSIQVYKKERVHMHWVHVAEVPYNTLCYYLEVEDRLSNVFLRKCHLVIHECGELLLLSATYRRTWCGLLYDLKTQRWVSHYIVDENRGNTYNDGLFFQPQLNVCP